MFVYAYVWLKLSKSKLIYQNTCRVHESFTFFDKPNISDVLGVMVLQCLHYLLVTNVPFVYYCQAVYIYCSVFYALDLLSTLWCFFSVHIHLF